MTRRAAGGKCAKGCAPTYSRCAGSGIAGVKACCDKKDRCWFKNEKISICWPKARKIPARPKPKFLTCDRAILQLRTSGSQCACRSATLLHSPAQSTAAELHHIVAHLLHPSSISFEMQIVWISMHAAPCADPKKAIEWQGASAQRGQDKPVAGKIAFWYSDQLDEMGTTCNGACLANKECAVYELTVDDECGALQSHELRAVHVLHLNCSVLACTSTYSYVGRTSHCMLASPGAMPWPIASHPSPLDSTHHLPLLHWTACRRFIITADALSTSMHSRSW
jgi:hypothetical protein